MKCGQVFSFLMIIYLFYNVRYSNSAKILMAVPSYSPSHLIVGAALLKGLAKRGHNVTMISSFPQKTPIPNYRDIHLELTEELTESVDKAVHIGNVRRFKMMMESVIHLFDYTNNTLKHPEVIRMMREETFDMVILTTKASLFLSGLAAHFDCPLVLLTQIRAPGFITQFVGNPYILATDPQILAGFESPMIFMDRVKNAIVSFLEYLVMTWGYYLEKMYYESNFPEPKYPKLDELLMNTSLVLSNYHFSQGVPFPNLPNVVEIGGIYIEDQLSELPKDIQEFLDSADEGAIYFSFGSNLKSDLLKKEKSQAIWNVLTKLPMKVIMKWENKEDFDNVPPHMFVSNWLPQNEILAHKNLKLFISHGGGGSLGESKYYGVPVIAIPMFGDQMANTEAAVKEGWAIRLNYNDLNEETLSKAVQTILQDSSFGEEVKKLSEIYKDRPQSPMDTAAYWIEYVIRHKGANHLKYPATQMNFIQNRSLDVLAFIVVIFIILIKILSLLLKLFVKIVKTAFRKIKLKED